MNLVMAVNAPWNKAAPNYANWQKYERPNVSGVVQMAKWSDIETSPGVYNFADFDKQLSAFPGMELGVVFQAQSLYADQNYVPAYVSEAIPSTQYTHSDGIRSIVPWYPTFAIAWRDFIAAAIAHYNLPSSPKLSYARFGFFRGGQASLQDVSDLQAIAGGPGQLKNNWLNTYSNMVETMKGQKFRIQLEIAKGPQDDVTYATTMAEDCVAAGVGIGSAGFQPSDSQKESSSDWVAMFNQYANAPINRMLQPLTAGLPLATMIPFALANKCNVLELEMQYVAGAFDPKGNTAWAAAIKNFME